MDSKMRQDIQYLHTWDCPWYWVEVVWVLRVSDQILWWARMSGISGHVLLKILIQVYDTPLTGVGSLKQHLATEDGYGHQTPMSDLLNFRIKAMGCPTSDEILTAALFEASQTEDTSGVWLKVHNHLKECRGSCASEVEHLGRYARELRGLKEFRLPDYIR